MSRIRFLVSFCMFLFCCPESSGEQFTFYGDRVGKDTHIPNPSSDELISKKYGALKAIEKLLAEVPDKKERLSLLMRKRDILNGFEKRDDSFKIQGEIVALEEQFSKTGFAPPAEYMEYGRWLLAKARKQEADRIFERMLAVLSKYPGLHYAERGMGNDCLMELAEYFVSVEDKESATKCYQVLLKQQELEQQELKRHYSQAQLSWQVQQELLKERNMSIEETRHRLSNMLWERGRYLDSLALSILSIF